MRFCVYPPTTVVPSKISETQIKTSTHFTYLKFPFKQKMELFFLYLEGYSLAVTKKKASQIQKKKFTSVHCVKYRNFT